ncbi:MAG: hypothetical protein JWM68_1433 [Verrucomicrobiales bacterium]|nr:hypothetical protein [Verrucomicrobiales bacterium]
MQPEKVKTVIAPTRLCRVELFFAVFLIALAAFFHFLLQKNAGAFWRDECSSILLARAKSWSDVFNGLFTDSFPALWVVLLRLWDLLGGGSGEVWIRSFGLWLSMGAIASLWYAAKTARLLPPVLAIALIAFNPAVFYWGDSLRAYALAMLLVVLLFGFVWRFCEEGGLKNFVIAAVTAILAAQSNYQSSYLILAICVAGALVCAVSGRRWRGVIVIGIGILAAFSMVPYRPVIVQYSESAKLLTIPDVNAALLWNRFSEGFDSTISLSIFVELYVLSLALPVYYRLSRAHQQNRDAFHRSLYASSAALIAPIGCYVFARKAGFSTQSWYYIPILGLFGIAIEMSISGLGERLRVRQLRLLLAGLVVVAGVAPVWKHAHMRRTTMDIAADQVSKTASADDLVLVNPFWEVVSFQYYYKGNAPWSILPVVPDEERGRSFSATMPLMTSREPLKTTYERIEKTLRNGGKLLVVGGLQRATTVPPEWIPAPHPDYGWQSSEFVKVWSMQTGWFMEQHALERKVLPVDNNQRVNRFEDVETIVIFSGWKD